MREMREMRDDERLEMSDEMKRREIEPRIITHRKQPQQQRQLPLLLQLIQSLFKKHDRWNSVDDRCGILLGFVVEEIVGEIVFDVVQVVLKLL